MATAKELRAAIEFWVMARYPEIPPDPNDLGAQGQMEVALDMAERTLRKLAQEAPVPEPAPDTRPPQEIALEAVRAIAAFHGANNGETVDRTVIRIAASMWISTVRSEWQAYVAADPELTAQHAVALELMKDDGYGADRMEDPICMMPGMKAMVARVDNQEAVCVDHCMAQVMPLSSIYVNRVRLVQSAAARVAKRLAEEAAKQPPEWPITIASGETFNSIEEMEASPIDAVKDMARMMKDAGMFACHPGFGVPEAQTCWQYFGFDGPVTLEVLWPKYLEAGRDADAKLAQEVQRQYQNCLRELGTAIMNGPATSGDTDE